MNKEIFEMQHQQYITSYSNGLTIRDDFINGEKLKVDNNYSVIYNGDEVDLGSFQSMENWIDPFQGVSAINDDGSRSFYFSNLNYTNDKKKRLESINKIGKNFNIFFLTTT
jgi:hypothetical protein